MYRLLQIDELQRSFHHFLTPEDDCFYFMEYTSNTDFRYSPSNDLISNFKKSPEHRDHPQWAHKSRAIWKVGNILAQTLLPAAGVPDVVIVPIPTSKRRDHPLYDDRMLQVLSSLQQRDQDVDVREILTIRHNMEATHISSGKRSPMKIGQNLLLNKNLCVTTKNKFLLVDDMITSGAHFIACKSKLLEQFPEAIIKGLFIARRTFKADVKDMNI